MKYVVKFLIPVSPEVWDQEVFEFREFGEMLEKIRKRRQKYRDPYTAYKLIDDIREYNELKSALEQKPEDVIVTLEVDTARLNQKELEILASWGAKIKVTISGTKINENDLQSLLSLAKKAELFNAKIDITNDVVYELIINE